MLVHAAVHAAAEPRSPSLASFIARRRRLRTAAILPPSTGIILLPSAGIIILLPSADLPSTRHADALSTHGRMAGCRSPRRAQHANSTVTIRRQVAAQHRRTPTLVATPAGRGQVALSARERERAVSRASRESPLALALTS